MPVLACFEDHDSKIRYYACESMYNIVRPRPLAGPTASTDAPALARRPRSLTARSSSTSTSSSTLCPRCVDPTPLGLRSSTDSRTCPQLAADPEVSVKNGAELLDRQLKDIVQDQAALYISRANHGDDYSPDVHPDGHHPGPEKDHGSSRPQPQRAFSLPRFIPLLHERLSVLNPFTRTFLISWLITLDQVPDLELITFLPDFLDGLLRYLGDPTDEVRCSTESLLEDLLREIREARKQQLEGLAARREAWERDGERRRRRRASEARTVTVGDTDGDGDEGDEWNGKGTPTPRTLGEHDDDLDGQDGEDALGDSEDDDEYPLEGDGSAEWLPGQGVLIEYGAIVEILVQHLSFPGASSSSSSSSPSTSKPSPDPLSILRADEEIQATCLHWISQFLSFVPGVVVPFAPRLIPVILSALAHHVEEIQQAASDTNDLLFAVIQALPVDGSSNGGANGSNGLSPASAADFSPPHSTLSTVAFAPNVASPPPSSIPFPSTSSAATPRPGHDRHKPGSDASSLLHAPPSALAPLSPSSDSSSAPHHLAAGPPAPPQGLGLALAHDFADPLEPDAARFAYGQTVNELTLQFLSDNEETRVAALEWLLMLHQKAPRKVRPPPSLGLRRSRAELTFSLARAADPRRRRPVPLLTTRPPVDARRRRRRPQHVAAAQPVGVVDLVRPVARRPPQAPVRLVRARPAVRPAAPRADQLARVWARRRRRCRRARNGGGSRRRRRVLCAAHEQPARALQHGPQAARDEGQPHHSAAVRQPERRAHLPDLRRDSREGRGASSFLLPPAEPPSLEHDAHLLPLRPQDLEFASVMVQNLNLIMITSPELSEFRKRLRTLDSKVRLSPSHDRIRSSRAIEMQQN